MAYQLDDFVQVKSEMARIAEKLEVLAEQRGEIDLAVRAKEMIAKLATEAFNLAVLGQFKRGKSTLINALLGADILPTAVVPLTSVVTILRYGPEPAAVVTFTDGSYKPIPLSELSDYITERGNPSNEKGVRRVEVSYPAPLLRDGVRLIDTPGVGSIFLNNTEVAYDFLPQVDAAILVLAADQPIGQAEVQFLRKAQQHAAKLFLLINKIDILSESELEESLEFCRQAIERELGATGISLYPISAKQALVGRLRGDRSLLDRSRLPELELALAEFLMREKGATMLEAAHKRLHEMIMALEQAIGLELTALMLAPQELAEKIEIFRQQIHRILQERQDVEYLLSGETKRLIAKVEEDLKPLIDEHVSPLQRRLIDFFEANKRLGKSKLVEAMAVELRRAVEQIFNSWRQQEEAIISQELTRIASRFEQRVNQIVEAVSGAAEGLFGIEVTPVIAVEPLTSESGHYYMVENPFTLQLDTLPLLLPAPLAKRAIRRRFVENVRLELERNAGRLRSDFHERIEKSSKRFIANFNEQVERALKGIQRTLERAASERAKSQERVSATCDALKVAQLEARSLRLRLRRLTLASGGLSGGR